ncbi:TPA: hypothetical protein ACH3X1_009054 [Trebouxia sp. C0004]
MLVPAPFGPVFPGFTGFTVILQRQQQQQDGPEQAHDQHATANRSIGDAWAKYRQVVQVPAPIGPQYDLIGDLDYGFLQYLVTECPLITAFQLRNAAEEIAKEAVADRQLQADLSRHQQLLCKLQVSNIHGFRPATVMASGQQQSWRWW